MSEGIDGRYDEDELRFLASCDPHAYSPAAVTVDVVALTIREGLPHVSQDGEPVRITSGDSPDLERQAALTRRLKGARPVFAPIPGEPAEAISHALGLPLAAVFAGPTRVDAQVPARRLPRTGALPRRLPV